MASEYRNMDIEIAKRKYECKMYIIESLKSEKKKLFFLFLYVQEIEANS